VVAQVNLSDAGVPKLPVLCATVTALGLEGDRQNDLAHHCGPDRALCPHALVCLTALQLDGHPIFAGTAGEDLTLGGLDWALIVPDVRLLGDEVMVEITQYASPCQEIASSFAGAEVARMLQERHPGWPLVDARVLAEGHIRIGDQVRLDAAARPISENTGTGRSA
jgi:MOSC domain-containing protein YiiM